MTRFRKMSLQDRAVMDKTTRAFVSYIRAYREHHCRFIFRLQDLDIGRLATGYGLLRLPKMPELKKVDLTNFEKPAETPDFDLIKYKDKTRERQRQQKLRDNQLQIKDRGCHADRNHKSLTRQSHEHGHGRKRFRENSSALEKGKRPQLKKSERKKQKHQDLLDIDKEYRLLKKLKKVCHYAC